MSLFAASADNKNPYDFGPAAGGPKPETVAEFNAAVNAWYQHRDKIVNETIPELDRAIGAVQSWATAVQGIANVLQMAIPLTDITTPAHEGRIQELASKVNDLHQVLGMLQNVRTAIPTLARAVNTLVAQ